MLQPSLPSPSFPPSLPLSLPPPSPPSPFEVEYGLHVQAALPTDPVEPGHHTAHLQVARCQEDACMQHHMQRGYVHTSTHCNFRHKAQGSPIFCARFESFTKVFVAVTLAKVMEAYIQAYTQTDKHNLYKQYSVVVRYYHLMSHHDYIDQYLTTSITTQQLLLTWLLLSNRFQPAKLLFQKGQVQEVSYIVHLSPQGLGQLHTPHIHNTHRAETIDKCIIPCTVHVSYSVTCEACVHASHAVCTAHHTPCAAKHAEGTHTIGSGTFRQWKGLILVFGW